MGAKCTKSQRDADYKNKVELALKTVNLTKLWDDQSIAEQYRRWALDLVKRLDASALYSRKDPRITAIFIVDWLWEWFLWHPGFGAVRKAKTKAQRGRNAALKESIERFKEDLGEYWLQSELMRRDPPGSVTEGGVEEAILNVASALGSLTWALDQKADPKSFEGAKYAPKDQLLLAGRSLSKKYFKRSKTRWTLLTHLHNRMAEIKNPNYLPIKQTSPRKLSSKYTKLMEQKAKVPQEKSR